MVGKFQQIGPLTEKELFAARWVSMDKTEKAMFKVFKDPSWYNSQTITINWLEIWGIPKEFICQGFAAWWNPIFRDNDISIYKLEDIVKKYQITRDDHNLYITKIKNYFENQKLFFNAKKSKVFVDALVWLRVRLSNELKEDDKGRIAVFDVIVYITLKQKYFRTWPLADLYIGRLSINSDLKELVKTRY